LCGTGAGTFSGANIKHRITINDASGEVFITAAQLEDKAYATDPIPTSGATATRAVSSISYGVSGLPTNDYSGSFTFLCPVGGSGTNEAAVTLVSAGADGIVAVGRTDISFSNGVGTASKTLSTPLTEGTEYLVEFSQSSTTGLSITVNGETATNADTTAIGTVTSIYPAANSDYAADAVAYTQIKNLKVTS
jgi:hypothetical protein